MLTMEQLKQTAPSVFALEPWQKVSDKYRFVPTIDVVNALVEHGFVPMSARQSRCRIEGKEFYTRHVIRFRHADLANIVGRQELLGVPEIVLLNSHDRSSSYKIFMGMFRQVCSNGLIAYSEDIGFTVRHSGAADLTQQVIDASYKVIESAPIITAKVTDWSSKMITPAKQIAFANAALELRDSAINVDPETLLKGRRHYDDAKENGDRDVWTTFNVVQENLIKGGLLGQSEKTKKFRHTRGIKSVNEDVKLNRALWRLTEELAKAA